MKKTRDNYDKLTETLKPLGFKHLGSGKFRHELTSKEFDFSASSIEGVPHLIYNSGVIDGKLQAQADIRNSLGIKS